MNVGIFIFLFANMYEIDPAVSLSFECQHIYQFPATFSARKLQNAHEISFNNSFRTSIVINSTCCEDIQPNGTDCRSCAGGRKRECLVHQAQIVHLQTNINNNCLNETTYHFTCLEQLCNGSFPPNYTTACNNETNARQLCRIDGSWEAESCNENITLALTSPIHQDISTETYKVTTDKNDPTLSTNHSEISSEVSEATTEQVTTIHGRYSGIPTAEITAPTDNETSTVVPFDDFETGNDWVDFLIALGVILVVVFVLVCGFFIRKRKREKEDNDYSLEYWQETEYIDSICGKASCTINPLPDHKSQDQPSQRYTRKDEYYSTCNDVPRKMKHDYADKYVTTATGSNFYSYRTSPDADLGDSGSEHSIPRIPRAKLDVDKMTSFKPKYSKKLQKGGRKQLKGTKSSDNIPDENEIYAVSYKNKLKRELNDWSADESDV